ncbi:ATP-binding protein [Falsibacillus pallidus]|uniref:histidine kinase n=1 Tax=Falsibacillus pallidus TaxID=493781 RepID=A0A370GFH9_9BACI|nr:ATP-binding protein [Falsibacillus pallidus]RDI41946.1 PAS domain S-box-containing protein [Falsibacillus pallidus]
MLTKKGWAAAAAGMMIVLVCQMFLGFIHERNEIESFIYIVLSIILIGGLLYLAVNGYRLLVKYQGVQGEEKRLSALIDSMPDFMCVKDGEGRWLKVNQFGLELYELTRVDYYGKTDSQLGEYTPFFKDALLYCIDSDEAAWENQCLTRTEESFYLRSGEFKTFDVIKVPLYHEDGTRRILITLGRDISQQKRTEAMLLKKEKLSVVGELSAGIAHEIRNPLTSLKGFIQLLNETENVTKEYLTIMSREIDRINQIVSELLVLAKPQSRIHSEFKFNEALDYVVNIMKHEALLLGIAITIKADEKDAVIFGDKNQVVQVLINIIKNALDAMGQKGGEVTVKVEHVEQKLKISIKDQGEGIPPERLKHLGEPFFTLKEKGMGLGLTISNKIIQEHKGCIDIKSELGIGTEVIIQLPLSQ